MSQSMFVAVPRADCEEYVNLAVMHTVEVYSAERCIIKGPEEFYREIDSRKHISAILQKLRGLDETKTDEEIRPQRP